MFMQRSRMTADWVEITLHVPDTSDEPNGAWHDDDARCRIAEWALGYVIGLAMVLQDDMTAATYLASIRERFAAAASRRRP